MFKVSKVCKKCKNKSDTTCKVCGKKRSQYLFEESCLKKHEEFIKLVHYSLKKFNMESTGCATLDMEVLDCCGVSIPSLPKDNPLHDFYERMKVTKILQLFHLFKFIGVNYTDFMVKYKKYLIEKQDEINYQIRINKLIFVE